MTALTSLPRFHKYQCRFPECLYHEGYPSPYAPGEEVKDIILNIHSDNDYAKVDSIKASTRIKTIYKADGIIDGNGDNLYDTDLGGEWGVSALKDGNPGDTVSYSIILQNDGNVSDRYTFSLIEPAPNGWTVLINDGIRDRDITNPSLAGEQLPYHHPQQW